MTILVILQHQLLEYEQNVILVMFASNLLFDKHISNIVHRANILIGIIKRICSCLDQSMFQTLYTTLIHLHLDYASVVWNPYQFGHIRTIEKVPR